MKRLDEAKRRQIGERLCTCRTNNKWSQLDVMKKTGISVNTISAIENGTQEFGLSSLLQFSKLYGKSVDYILNGKTQQQYDDELCEFIMRMPPSERKRWLGAFNSLYSL